MKTIPITILLLVFCGYCTVNSSEQPDWRFGFEWNEGSLLGWEDPKLEALLSRLQELGTGGAINVNSHSSWARMQPAPSSAIDWLNNDTIVQLFQRFDLGLTWYITPDAPWAFPNKPECQPDTVETPFGDVLFYHNCAPASEFEPHWTRYVKSIVERYDGDGIDDMPGLERPIRFYIMPGEIKFGISGSGDKEKGPFWYDSIDALLRLHRLTFDAVHEADANGAALVSSGAVFWDLYADFPDYPEFDPQDEQSTLQKRLRGDNYKGSLYTAGRDSIKKMLAGFGDDSDGVACDYIGWHPHFSWRVIDQEFALIRHYTDLPIYVDDMWSNIFSSGYYFGAAVPGGAQFQAQPYPPANTNWITQIYGDFPNSLFTSKDPFHELYQGLLNRDSLVTAWYYANGARNVVKSFVSAFGEGAECASFSGTNDVPEMRNWRWGNIGWINLLDTRAVDYARKPQYHTCKLLIDKLHNFTSVKEIPVSSDPRTRVYRFERPRGPVYVLWSDTGPVPPDRDYRIATGDTIFLQVESDSLSLTRIITGEQSTAETQILAAPGKQFSCQLGFEPFFLEPKIPTRIGNNAQSAAQMSLLQNHPNPFNGSTTISYRVHQPGHVKLTVYNLQGKLIQTLVDAEHSSGWFDIAFNSALASGVYFYRIQIKNDIQVNKMTQVK